MFPHGLSGASSETPIENDKDRDNDRQPQCQERGVPQAKLPGKYFIDIQTNHLGRGAGSATGQQENFIENLEGENGAQHDCRDQGRSQERQRDVAQNLRFGGTVHTRGFVDLLRHGFQSRQDDEEHKAGPVPQVHQDDRGHCELRVSGPGGRGGNADEFQHLIDEAIVVIVHQTPHGADGDGRDQQWDE